MSVSTKRGASSPHPERGKPDGQLLAEPSFSERRNWVIF
jgi:hypothetical protein